MGNPLEGVMTSPAAPNPDAGSNGSNALQQGAPAQAGPQKAPPAPTHAQTVAALRHADAIKNELSILLKNDALGKSSIKSAIIDGATKLVAERIMPASDAVPLLASVPDDPIQQRKWVQQHLMNAIQSEHAVLDQHRNTNLGSGDWATESQQHNTSPDNHMQDVKALGAQYG